jgi:Domain of unknown function (DUF4412)
MRWREGHGVCILCCGLVGCSHMSTQSTAGDTGDLSVEASGGAVGSPAASAVHRPPPFPAAGPFEGNITWGVAGQKPLVVVLRVKGEKMRFESTATSTYTIRDLADSTEVTVSPEARTVTRKSSAAGDFLTTPGLMLQPAATGAIDWVAGYQCEVYQYRLTVADTGDCCMVTGIPFAFDARDGGSLRTARVADLFSLRTRAIGPAGDERSRTEVTKIEPKTLDTSLFIVPHGYRIIPQPGLQR